MKFYNVIEAIKELIKHVPNVGDVNDGDIYNNFNAKEDVLYPAFNITAQEVTENRDEYYTDYHLYLFAFDRLTTDEGNMIEVQSHCIQMLKSIITKMEEAEVIVNTVTYHTFREKLNDVCAGAYADVVFRLDIDDCGNYEITFGNEDLVKLLRSIIAEKQAEITEKNEEIKSLQLQVGKAYEEGFSTRDSLTSKELQLITENGTYHFDWGAENIEVLVGSGECEEVIKELEKHIAEKDAQIRDLEAQIQALQDEVNTLHSEINSLQSEIANLQWQIAEKDENIAELVEQIAQLQNNITDLQSEINTLNEQISTLENRIADKDRYIEELEALITEKDNIITQKDGEISRLQDTIDELNGEITEKDALIASLQQQLADAPRVIECTQAQYDESHNNKDIYAIRG